MRSKNVVVVIAILGGAQILNSCKDNPSSFEEEPPRLPPESSMEMNFSTFEDGSAQARTGERVTAADSLNHFAHAVTRAFVMSVAVELNLAIPRALLKAAENADAELNDEGEWVWSYSNSVNNTAWEARLVAAREGEDQVHWSLYVTNTGQNIEDRLFFEGTTDSDGTDGSWTYYDLQAAEPMQAVSKITWEITGEGGENVQIRLDILSDRNGYLCDYIEYTDNGTVKRAVYYNATGDTITEIQWNTETHEGYIIAPDYNNGQKACWNSGLVITTCS